jgi:hypothetical protein
MTEVEVQTLPFAPLILGAMGAGVEIFVDILNGDPLFAWDFTHFLASCEPPPLAKAIPDQALGVDFRR